MILKGKDNEKEVTTAYSGGERTTNSFSRFGKKKKALNEEKSEQNDKKEYDSGEAK